MASDFYLVLPSNSSMDIHPNNTLAQYITNLPRRISLYGEWECGLTEIHYPHDWYNVRNARMVVEHEESVHNVYLDDGYYDSPETFVEALNIDKPSRVKFSYREFGSIETEIRDDTGRPVPFERGKVTVTLHFRRRSTGLFR